MLYRGLWTSNLMLMESFCIAYMWYSKCNGGWWSTNGFVVIKMAKPAIFLSCLNHWPKFFVAQNSNFAVSHPRALFGAKLFVIIGDTWTWSIKLWQLSPNWGLILKFGIFFCETIWLKKDDTSVWLPAITKFEVPLLFLLKMTQCSRVMTNDPSAAVLFCSVKDGVKPRVWKSQFVFSSVVERHPLSQKH